MERPLNTRSVEPWGIEPQWPWIGSPDTHQPAPFFVCRTQLVAELTRRSRNPDSGNLVKAKPATPQEDSTHSDAVFKRTLRKMLSASPKPHSEMKKEAAPKAEKAAAIKAPSKKAPVKAKKEATDND